MFESKAEPSQVEHLLKAILKKPARDKLSSSLDLFVNYGCKKFVL
jgi:hypothetical protein